MTTTEVIAWTGEWPGTVWERRRVRVGPQRLTLRDPELWNRPVIRSRLTSGWKSPERKPEARYLCVWPEHCMEVVGVFFRSPPGWDPHTPTHPESPCTWPLTLERPGEEVPLVPSRLE